MAVIRAPGETQASPGERALCNENSAADNTRFSGTPDGVIRIFADQGKTLAKQLQEGKQPGEIKLSIDVPEPTGDGNGKALSADEVKKILREQQAEAEE